MKRGRGGGILTGGTGDVSPQFLSFRATQSAADTTTTTTQAIPTQRLPDQGKAQVMEVLKIFFIGTNLPTIASATETQDQISVFLSTTSFGTTNTTFQESRVFAGFINSQRGAFTAAGTYAMTQTPYPHVIDTSDGAGHGVLIATDNIFAQVQSVGTGATNVADLKLLYRWKNVSLQEYIGIVQSQQ